MARQVSAQNFQLLRPRILRKWWYQPNSWRIVITQSHKCLCDRFDSKYNDNQSVHSKDFIFKTSFQEKKMLFFSEKIKIKLENKMHHESMNIPYAMQKWHHSPLL